MAEKNEHPPSPQSEEGQDESGTAAESIEPGNSPEPKDEPRPRPRLYGYDKDLWP
ncbi:hypothetical protein ABIA70_003280 [Arthrobacter sp. 754]